MPVTIGAKRESDFNDPLGMLSDCHRRIEMFLRALQSVCVQARGARLDSEQRSALEASLRYFREAAPKHTADEEESLFPRLRESSGAAAEALLARVEALEKDHGVAAAAHDEVEQLGRKWLAEGELPADEAARLVALVEQLAEMYRHHIDVEDREVFPAAGKILSGADRSTIGREMAARRGIERPPLLK
jgi:hemerythrin-like domain-containing protein